jgi:hypothetical protein
MPRSRRRSRNRSSKPLSIVFIAVVVLGVSSCDGGGGGAESEATVGTFWDAAGRDGSPVSSVDYPDLADLLPSAPTAYEEFLKPEVVAVGRVTSIDPGIAYADSRDAASSPIVPFDDPEAAFKWVKLTFQLDDVVDTSNSSVKAGDQVVFEVPLPTGLTLDQAREANDPTIPVLAFLVNSLAVFEQAGTADEPEIDAEYHGSVMRVVAGDLFVADEETGALSAPYIADEVNEDELLGEPRTLDAVVAGLKDAVASSAAPTSDDSQPS